MQYIVRIAVMTPTTTQLPHARPTIHCIRLVLKLGECSALWGEREGVVYGALAFHIATLPFQLAYLT